MCVSVFFCVWECQYCILFNAMSSRQDIFVVDERSTACEHIICFDHGHPRIFVHVRKWTTNDFTLTSQSSASLNHTPEYFFRFIFSTHNRGCITLDVCIYSLHLGHCWRWTIRSITGGPSSLTVTSCCLFTWSAYAFGLTVPSLGLYLIAERTWNKQI